MKRKILFLDLDGTLLNDAKEITDGNRKALEQALALGHRVVVATGRPLISALAQNKRLGLTASGCYVIAYNGGMVYDVHGEQVIYQHTLDRHTALAAIRLADKHHVHVQTYDNECVVVEPHCDDEAVRRYCRIIKIEHKVTDDLDAYLTYDPPKVLAISFEDRASIEGLERELNEQLGGRMNCFFSSHYYLEIVPSGMNKGNAIRRMCEQLGMDVADSIAVGDEANDLAMLSAAGVGVAMANGIDAVKAVADYVTTNDNNHDGIAEVVERFLLH